jgi:aarF domain-containing kinase
LEALKEVEEKEQTKESFITPSTKEEEAVVEKSVKEAKLPDSSDRGVSDKAPETIPTPPRVAQKVLDTRDAAKPAGDKAIEAELTPEVAAPAAEAPTKPEQVLSKEDASLIADLTGSAPVRTYELRESRVPSSRISRLWNYGGLAAGMFAGAIGEGLSRAVGGGGSGSVMLSAANMERLVAKLSRMRGAALKLGQMMSFQDAKMLPAPIQEVLQRVQDRADYMPAWQRDRVLSSNLGADWRDLFGEFEDKPIAAASIGQVHRATLKSNGARVAVKIQFPGVADSINSDLDNLAILLAATKLLPKGLYLNKTIDNARTELSWECDYIREAECAERYRQLLTPNDSKGDDDDVFSVPRIYREASGKHVLTMEFMNGVGVTRIKSFTQEQRDWIGTQILRLCLREITEFRFMQTDPNWTNFLYNAANNKLELLDFGASREYPDRFITLYVALLEAASRSDRDRVKALSEDLGYLTGHESKTMLDAHVTSVLTLAEPFLRSAPEVYDFRDQTITERVKAQIPIMIHERLAPPPEETYSLHRKLSGAFLLCARLGSRVRCRELFESALEKTGYLRN